MSTVGAPSAGRIGRTYSVARWLGLLRLGGGAVATSIGVLGLIGWWADVPLLRSGVPGHPPILPNTAALFVLAGGSVLTVPSRRARALPQALAVLLTGLATVIVLEWVIDRPLGIDRLLLPEPAASFPGAHVGRVSIQLAVALLLFGVLRLTTGVSGARARRLGDAAAIGFGVIVLAVVLGYAFGAGELTRGHSMAVVSVPSVAGLLALAAPAVTLKADPRPVRWLFERSLAGSAVRRLLPAAVVVPPVLGVLRLYGEEAQWYGTRLGLALFTGSMITTFVGLITYTAVVIARTETETRAAADRLATFLDSIPDATVVIDEHGIIRYANGQVTTVLGYGVAELVGQQVEVLVPESVKHRHTGLRVGYNHQRRPMGGLDLTARHREGHEIPVDISLGPVGTGPDTWTLASVRDVTEQRAAQDQLRAAEERYRQLAEHDPLTGLWNRRRFSEELEAHLALCRRGEASGALLSLDLDHFKTVNDTYGHHIGDRLLTSIADAMRRTLRASDGVARQGGDEFLVLLRSGDQHGAVRAANALVAAVRGSTELLAAQVGPQVAVVTASVGVVAFDELAVTELTSAAVLIRADHALYAAKASGRDRASVAVPAGVPSTRILD
ncbi:sensor domain-containing diguanylate cyclase [Nocardioides nematodiphilus]|uniref:sensor domain-containing diguanylate cyclase n=1 Tax=Nocardioides nematodiphilus TaxID=2849669 RepID=UPI001CD9BCBF|nr:sensor domain-containing diguanylate cyclase [Nocardioides nematodiphilus]MCA1982945.1 sensor domain-containing diguanylate cyclase [Nocardioides nematodiphilus]